MNWEPVLSVNNNLPDGQYKAGTLQMHINITSEIEFELRSVL